MDFSKVNSCYVCDHFRSIYGRYLDTFFDLYLKNEEFRQMFENSKGFCLPHFGDLIETAENKLNDAQKKDFYAIAFPLMQENMERLQKEVSWFVERMITAIKIRTGELPPTVSREVCRNAPGISGGRNLQSETVNRSLTYRGAADFMVLS